MAVVCSALRAQLNPASQLCVHLPLPKGEKLRVGGGGVSLQGFGEGEEMGRRGYEVAPPSSLPLSLGASLALCKDSQQECQSWRPKEPAGRAATACLGEPPGGSGFLDIGSPKPNQIPSGRLM